MQAAFAGVDLSEGTKSSATKLKEAEAKLQDPLKSFPDDVKYLNGKDCDVKIRLTNNPKLSLPFEQKWDEYRKTCCLGEYGMAARRCSMNNTLWGRYLKSIEVKKPLDLEIIKIMVEFDMARRELYPPDYKGSEDAPPPEDYVKEMKTSGKYSEIMQKLNAVSKRLQQYGTSTS